MTKANPMGDDFGSSWFAKTPPSAYSKRRRDVVPSDNADKKPKEPAELYTEKDIRHWRIESIYGKQEEYVPMRRGRREK